MNRAAVSSNFLSRSFIVRSDLTKNGMTKDEPCPNFTHASALFLGTANVFPKVK